MLSGLLGHPLGHSFSQALFANRFKELGIAGSYLLFDIDKVADIPSIWEQHPDLRGFNVTIPYKETIIAMLDELSPEAYAIGAVNTVSVNRNSTGEVRLSGYNTDAPAFEATLRPLLQPGMRRALIFGTGGASKAAAYALNRLGIEYKFVSRSPKGGICISYGDLDEDLIAATDLLVNCTPVGMSPNVDDCIPIPYNALRGRTHICYDMIYNPSETEFLRRCRQADAVVCNGMEMLRIQAQLAWEIWQKR